MSKSDNSPARLQFLGIYHLVPRLHSESAWTQADGIAVEQHLARLQEAAKQGTVILAGRTLEENERTFGIVVFEASDKEEAWAFMKSDPTVLAGVMTFELHPYRVAVCR